MSRKPVYSTKLIGSHATRFIREMPDGGSFFPCLPSNAVQSPNHVTEEHTTRNARIESEERRLKAVGATATDDEIGRVLKGLDE